MKTSQFTLVLSAVLLWIGATTSTGQNPTPLLTQPADKLIAILKSDATQKEKADACRQLAVIGTKDAVPALAALLPDEKLNHMARYALETIPDASADKALRESLGTLKGRPLVGVIGSIGVRHDAKAVPDLAKRLSDADTDVAQAAARALGKIANSAAVNALKQAVGSATAVNQVAFCEGLFRCAETLQAKGKRKQAIAIYDQLRSLTAPHQVRAGALRGAILARGRDGVKLLREQLLSKDPVLFAATIRAAYEMPFTEVTKALADSLTQLGQHEQILVVQALGKRGDSMAVPALASAAKSAPKAVRLAAVRALGETGRPAAAPVLAELLGDNDREIASVALESFAGIQGKEADATVVSMLGSQDTSRRLGGIELAGQRRMRACLPDLLKGATDLNPQIRVTAISKVGELGNAAEFASLLDLLPRLQTPRDLDAAEQALSTIASRSDHPEQCTERLTARLAVAQPAEKATMLQVLSSIGGPGALQAVRTSLSDANPQVHDAALRALSAWKNAEAAPDLLALAKSAGNPTDRTLCLRSYLGFAANADLAPDQRLNMCRNAVDLAKGTEEKKLLLAALGGIDSPESIALIAPFLDDAATKEEASAAVASIAEKMLKNQKAGSSVAGLIQPLEKVAQVTANEELSKRAKSLLQQAQKLPTK